MINNLLCGVVVGVGRSLVAWARELAAGYAEDVESRIAELCQEHAEVPVAVRVAHAQPAHALIVAASGSAGAPPK